MRSGRSAARAAAMRRRAWAMLAGLSLPWFICSTVTAMAASEGWGGWRRRWRRRRGWGGQEGGGGGRGEGGWGARRGGRWVGAGGPGGGFVACGLERCPRRAVTGALPPYALTALQAPGWA